MIDTDTLIQVISKYTNYCQERNKQPTYNGVGYALGISGVTVRHIVTGYYKDNMAYTDKPHILRCIDNKDFSIVQDLFNKDI